MIKYAKDQRHGEAIDELATYGYLRFFNFVHKLADLIKLCCHAGTLLLLCGSCAVTTTIGFWRDHAQSCKTHSKR